jgi:hypothetical protein
MGKEKLWVWIVIGASILVLGVITGFWQHLFTHSHPNAAFQIGQDDRMIPAVKGYSADDYY